MGLAQNTEFEAQIEGRARSQASLDFEALWRALPRKGLVPERGAFNPGRARKFLRKLVLIGASTGERPGLYVRLAGDSLNENVQRNMTGANWLDFLPHEYHAGAMETARLISEHPCGIWQLTPVHYERGYANVIEITVFPLGRAADGTPLMLGNLEFLESSGRERVVRGKGLSVETAKIFAFIDIGAGTPIWQSP